MYTFMVLLGAYSYLIQGRRWASSQNSSQNNSRLMGPSSPTMQEMSQIWTTLMSLPHSRLEGLLFL